MLRKTTRRVLGTVAIAATMAVVTATGANAAPNQANRVPCTDVGAFMVWNYNHTGQLCFLGPGGTSVKIYDINEIDTGNNFGAYTMNGGKLQAFDKWQHLNFGNNPELVWFTLNPCQPATPGC